MTDCPDELAVAACCEVHGDLLVPGWMERAYGHPGPVEWMRERRELFPNARSWTTLGCVIGPDMPPRPVMYCSACRAAEETWRPPSNELTF